MLTLRHLALAAALCASGATQAADLFPLRDVRLAPGPFLEAQQTDLRYLMALDPDRLLAPFRREAGLPAVKQSYGNWESSGLDGHMGGHYLTALALMHASTGDRQVKERLDYFVRELKRCQDAGGDGYLGGVPGGKEALDKIARGELHADNFSVNGKWVPWYNLHKTFAGLRDAYRIGGNQQAKTMLVAYADWALALTAKLSDTQMQAMLRAEHGGMNEVLADVAEITGDSKYLELAKRFSHRAVLDPLAQGKDQLTGLHANTQIPKVIGFERVGTLANDRSMRDAARFFWQTVVENRSVAIGGNSVREHFHDHKDFGPMIDDVEGPETCNTYNMLKLTELLFADKPQSRYGDYYERALYNHILSSQHPQTGGFVYFTPMRPNHYRVYSQVDKGMWCCVGSGIESHAKYGQFIYAKEADALFVNLFIPSELAWAEKNVRITQATSFPDEESTRITVHGTGKFAMKLRHPAWVASGALKVKVNGRPVKAVAGTDGYVSIDREWRDGDTVELKLPMTTRLEQMPDKSNWYAVLHGPIVLAAKTAPILDEKFRDEKLNVLADDSRMGHIAKGEICPLGAAPMLVSDAKDFTSKIKPVKGQPLTFTAPDLIRGQGNAAQLKLVPFFRLHDARYTMYWQRSTPSGYAALQEQTAQEEKERLALNARTIDQVAPGEQQPESDHGFMGEGADAGIHGGRHWRHATGWFSYVLNNPKGEAKILRLTFASADAGRRFDIVVGGKPLAALELKREDSEFYHRDFALPEGLGKKVEVKFVAQRGSIAGGLYGLRLLR
ncbi:glycoside hydrolase family 127 protein [Pseudoduganella sp. SL102]|uniref:glycoside hydrolase family 127 protein n=1 Tax=Pseudoduganella sp. SL102 TaxID=2995154 RepID=UPI00248BDD03|nr:glycoside hydrolase family 127 protein [Pseudoduganella sp. SL102]WBS00954.1 glycoside hydrolase family 127 protein [Pseudoduganella sp. SL102]